MEREFDTYQDRKLRLWLWMTLIVLIAFAGGVAAMGYAVTHDARTAHLLHLLPAGQARVAEAAIPGKPAPVIQPAGPPATASASLPPDPQITTRVTTLEDKVDDIETQAREATGDASRAEGLLVAFAARRALDRGVELGYIEGLLRQRFGGTQPQAVAAILSAARLPVTLADLQNGLDAIAPTLSAGGTPRQGWWQSFRQELGNMVVVRKTGEPSTAPADRVARAQRMMEAGQVDGALAEVVRLPDHAAADKWIPTTRRYLAGRAALDQIETAALLDPATSAGGPWQAPASRSPTPVPAVSPTAG